MRFNEKELAAVALQPLNKFDKEGPLIMREKVDSLFRRGEVLTERWCRLRGNMLFYFKNKDQYSEPTGIFILEKCAVCLDTTEDGTGFNFTLSFDGDGSKVQFTAPSEVERDSWIQCLHMASYEYMRCQLQSLQTKLREKTSDAVTEKKTQESAIKCRSITDFGDSYLEMCVACDNLICDGDGLPPSTFIVVAVYEISNRFWNYHSQTEIVQKCSNPCFMTTIKFKIAGADEMHPSTQFKLTAHDVRERLTLTMTILGSTTFKLQDLLEAKQCRLRRPLTAVDGVVGTGFVSVALWQVEMDHGLQPFVTTSKTEPPKEQIKSKTSTRAKLPIPLKTISSRLTNLCLLFDNIICQTYRFHTGLGADLSVHEIMGESKLSYTLPHNILQLYIREEKEMLTTLTSLGELKGDWNKSQLEAIERHLHLINSYNWALENMEPYAGLSFKPSSKKGSGDTEFVPVNLHLQRMWVLNDTTKKSGVHDVITVGGFCAHSCKFSRGGLLQLQSKLRRKSVKQGEINDAFNAQPLTDAYTTVVGIQQLRSEVNSLLDQFMDFAQNQDTYGLTNNMEKIHSSTTQLLHICDNRFIEKANQTLESIRVSSCSQQPNKIIAADGRKDTESNGDSEVFVELGTEVHDYVKDEQLCDNENVHNATDRVTNDVQITKSKTPEEQEPLDLTRLNIEASVLCMSSKIQSLQSPPSGPDGYLGKPQCDYVKDLTPSVNKLKQAMDAILQSAQVAHAILALSEPSKHGADRIELLYRRDIIFSHSLTALVTALLTRFWCDRLDAQYMYNLRKIGILAQFEGLMTCHSEEMGMIEDMVIAIKDLENVTFKLFECDCQEFSVPVVSGKRTAMTVDLPFPSLVFAAERESWTGTEFRVTPVFLNIGINEQASFAERDGRTSCMQTVPSSARKSISCMYSGPSTSNRFGDLSLQDRINNEGAGKLREFVAKYQDAVADQLSGAQNAETVAQLMDKLTNQIHVKKPKNVEILHLGAEICRHVGGLRFTSCKSAKDRTSMSVTLEQCLILKKCYDMADHEFLHGLECMRSEGTRIENTLKNAGVRKYAFNSLQLMSLPRLYRPPAGTYGNVQT